MMSVQYLRPRKDVPIVIETPEGLISIQAGKHRGLRIECPGKMVAHLGEERALKSARFVSRRNGSVTPKYQILKPVLDEKGHLVGLETPELFVVEGDMPSNVHLAEPVSP